MTEQAFDFIEKLLKSTEYPIVAIDGRSAAGKTTLAGLLAERFSFGVVHMDHFFLPPELRTAERLSKPGGNVHSERFIEEVVPNLHSGSFEYRVFSCKTMRLEESAAVSGRGVIVEGAYSMHPIFGNIYDAGIFMDITPQLQKKRIIARGGEDKWEQFKQRWIPLEECYHSHYNVINKCGLVLKTEE